MHNMELMEIFEAISGSDSHEQSFWHVIKACEDHKILASKSDGKIHPIVGHINRKLNTPTSRANGLQLLKVLLPQCSDDVFVENAVSWMLQCVKGVESHSKLKTGQISYEILQLLLESSAQLQELTKPVATTVVPKLLDALQKTPHQISLSALKCLETLLRNYGGPCGPHRTTVERFVLGFVDEECNLLVNSASHCVALFPLMGGGGTGGLNHSSAWLSLQQQLIASLNHTLDELFQNITEIQMTSDVSVQKLTLPDISETNPTVGVYRTARRFVNIAEFLQALYINEFPVAKSVLPNSVFGLVCRGLAVTSKTLGKKVSNEKLALGSVLPQIHLALFRILRSLIACCGGSLLQYGSLICKLVCQTLKWTAVSNWTYGMEKPHCKLRSEVCETLVDWLICAKTGSCVEQNADELVLLLRAEIVSTAPTVTLTANTTSGKHLSKQQRKKLKSMSGGDTKANAMDMNFRRARLIDSSANQKLCRAALQALEWIIHSGGLFIQPTVHKSLQETVIPLLLDIQRAPGPGSYPLPYSVPTCREALYSLLATLTLDPHPTWPAPTQYSLHLLAMGQMDPIAQVSAFCTVALRDVRNIVHPAHPSLEFPKSAPEEDRLVPRHVNGSASESNYIRKGIQQPLIRKRNHSSPGETNVAQTSKRIRADANKPSHKPTLEKEIITSEDSDSDEVTEIFQISNDDHSRASKLKTKSTHLTEIIVEEDYVVEEADDDEIYMGTSRTTRRMKDINRKNRSTDSPDKSPLRIMDLVEGVEAVEEEIEIERPNKRNKTEGSKGVVDKQRARRKRVDDGGSTDSTMLNTDIIESVLIPDECEAASVIDDSSSSSSESSDLQQGRSAQSAKKVVSPNDNSEVVQVSDSNEEDQLVSEDELPKQKSPHKSSTKPEQDSSDIEEIDLSKEDVEDEDDEEWVIEEIEQDEEDEDNTEQDEEDDDKDQAAQRDETKNQKSVPTSANVDADDVHVEIDLADSNEAGDLEKSPAPSLDDKEVESNQKESDKRTEMKDGEVVSESDTAESKNEISAVSQEKTPTANGEADPIETQPDKMEIGEEEMLTSFVDVVKPEVASVDVTKTTEET